ncbi:hypothetical protein [Providencia rettgeri]|uniref:hypothetical protein n=1 Tax=Providencia rettgeri TaxID=587 RepID=UPI0010139652|nr:hypothetical protein [Providencia rettgeri]
MLALISINQNVPVRFSLTADLTITQPSRYVPEGDIVDIKMCQSTEKKLNPLLTLKAGADISLLAPNYVGIPTAVTRR